MYGFQEPAKFDGNGNGEIACSSKKFYTKHVYQNNNCRVALIITSNASIDKVCLTTLGSA